MMLKNSFVLAALSASSAIATYTPDFKLNAYWGQAGPSTDTLGAHCESDSIDYVTLAFVNNSPEHGNGTNYPGTNFAAHCAADVYVKSGQNSKLLSGCSFIKEDIQKCQKLGKKVLLSIGGEYTATSNYSLTTVQNGVDFAEFLFYSFGPFMPGYNGPRPFDPSSTNHTSVDGFDFDIETKFANQEPYVHMVNHLRDLISNNNQDMILTAAPQCPQSNDYFQMKTILQEAKFDKIWIQFYNNPSCDAVTPATFNYDLWEDFITGGINDAAKLFIGLPGSVAASHLGSGYITHAAAKSLICSYKNRAHFGGAMVWDAYYASTNKNLAGQAYNEALAEALKCGGCAGDVCKPPTTTSSSVSSSATSTVSTTFSTTSSAASSTSTASETCTDSTTSSSSSATTTSSSSSYIATSSSAASSTETCTDSTSSSATSSSTVSSSTTTSSYVVTSSSSETASETCTDSTTSSSVVTSTSSVAVSTTSSYSASSTSSEEDDCPPDDETSSSYIESATVSVSAITTGSVSASQTITSSSYPTATTTSSSASASGSGSAYPSSSPITSSATTLGYTTSTVLTTKVYTVTSCAPSITNCPGKVVTETIPLYTTVCPITATETQKPITTPITTTSTIYSTRVSTITKCPAWVTNCPANSVTVSTETIPVSTTVVTVAYTTPAISTPAVFTSAVYSTKVGSATTETVTIGLTTYPAGSGSSETTPATSAATYPAGSASQSKPVSVAVVSSSTIVYTPTTIQTVPVPVYPTGSSNGTASAFSSAAGTGYPVKPTTTTPGAGYTAIACSGGSCSAAADSSSASYPTASVVTAGASTAKAATTFGFAGVLAVAAALVL